MSSSVSGTSGSCRFLSLYVCSITFVVTALSIIWIVGYWNLISFVALVVLGIATLVAAFGKVAARAWSMVCINCVAIYAALVLFCFLNGDEEDAMLPTTRLLYATVVSSEQTRPSIEEIAKDFSPVSVNRQEGGKQSARFVAYRGGHLIIGCLIGAAGGTVGYLWFRKATE